MSYQPPQDPHFYGPTSPAPYQQPGPQYVVVQAPPSSGLATASMVMGILGLVVGCCSFGIFSLLAIVFGHMATGETKSGAKQGHGMAVAGLVMGYVVFLPALAFSILVGFSWVLGVAEVGTSLPTPTP